MSKVDENVEVKESTSKKTKATSKKEGTTTKAKSTAKKDSSTEKKGSTTAKSKSTAKAKTTAKKEEPAAKGKSTTKAKTASKKGDTTVKNKVTTKKENKTDKEKTSVKKQNKVAKKETIKSEEIDKVEPENHIDVKEKKIEINEIEVNETIENETEINKEENESKYDTVSLKQIREALENKVDKKQRKSVIKDVFINLSIAIAMVIYLILILVGSKNLAVNVLEKDVKVITLCILAIGIFILEKAYKKDNVKIAMNAIEILAFGASNLCLIYVLKLYFDNLSNVITYITLGVGGYYILKSIFLTASSVKKFKRDNNDIKEIIKKI